MLFRSWNLWGLLGFCMLLSSCNFGNVSSASDVVNVPILNTKNMVVGEISTKPEQSNMVLKMFSSSDDLASDPIHRCDNYGGIDSLTQKIPLVVPKDTVYPMSVYINCKSGSQFNISNDVHWKSYDNSVFQVSESGLLSALKKGTAGVSYTINSLETKVYVDVTDPGFVAVSVVADSPVIALGEKTRLRASAIYADGEVEEIPHYNAMWSSFNHDIATVDIFGFVYPVSPGVATIKVAHSNRSTTTEISVTPAKVVSISIESSSLLMNSIISNEKQLHAFATYSDATTREINIDDLTCHLADNSIATIDNNCKVILKSSGASGTASIKVSYSGFESTGVFSVVRTGVSALIVEAGSNHQVMNGSYLPYKVYAKIGNAYYDETANIRLTSSNSNVGLLDNTGYVKAVGYGSATVSAKFENIDSSIVESSITLYVNDITISPSNETYLYIGDTYDAVATYKNAKDGKSYSNIQPVEYTSSDENILEINDNQWIPKNNGAVLIKVFLPTTGQYVEKVYNVSYNRRPVAYIANSNDSSGLQVEMCDIEGKSLANCQNTGFNVSGVRPYSVIVSKDKRFAYVGTGSDGNGTPSTGIYRCNINSIDLKFYGCSQVVANSVNTRSLHITNDGNSFYYSNMYKKSLDKCSIDQSSGALNHCSSVVAVAAIDRMMVTPDEQYAYIGGSTLQTCNLNSKLCSSTYNNYATGYGGMVYNKYNGYYYFMLNTPLMVIDILADGVFGSSLSLSGVSPLSNKVDVAFYDASTAYASQIGSIYECAVDDVISSYTYGKITACTKNNNVKSNRAENIFVTDI